MSFATIEDLKERLDWELTDEEVRIGESALEDLSVDACYYGSSNWDPEDPSSAPSLVASLVLRAAARFMRNPDAYIQSRSGDEMLMWAEKPAEEQATPTFNKREIDALRALVKGAGPVSIASAGMNWIPRDARHQPRVYAPNYYAGPKPMEHAYGWGQSFPFFATESDPHGEYVVDWLAGP